MPRRVELDPDLPPIALSSRVLNEMCAHAVETLPEECCGLLAGDTQVRHLCVVRCRNEMARQHRLDPRAFPRDGTQAFYMNPLDYAQAEKRAEAQGREITAVYHSHVGFGVYLSELDLEYAEQATFPFPAADHIVIAVSEDGRVGGVGLFEREREGAFRGGRRVVAEHG